jgi:predicted metalloendopeptidase
LYPKPGKTGAGPGRFARIPPDRARYGAFDALRELSERRVIGLLDELSREHATLPAEATPEEVDRVKLAGLYAS